MSIHIPDLSGTFLVYFLVFARVGAMIMLLPAIGDAGVPSRVRLALALAVSFALAPVVAKSYPDTAPANVLALGLLIAQELTVGVLIGAMARIIMSSLSVAGDLISMQTGLSYAQSFNPSMGAEDSIFSTFFTLLGVVLIFATDLHHLAIGAIEGSYSMIPPGAALPTSDMAELALRLTSGAFALGLQLAAPFIVFAFVVNAAIGLLARMMPQLQVFFIAMPVNILAGLFLLLLLIGSLMTLFLNYYATEMGHLT
jgi:flagellar biosynthetic protein FliR